MKETSQCFCQTGVNFLRHLALQMDKKTTWWQLASRFCWNRARFWRASQLFSFLIGLRTYQQPGTLIFCYYRSHVRKNCVKCSPNYVRLASDYGHNWRKATCIILPRNCSVFVSNLLVFNESLLLCSHTENSHCIICLISQRAWCIFYYFVLWPGNAQLFLSFTVHSVDYLITHTKICTYKYNLTIVE